MQLLIKYNRKEAFLKLLELTEIIYNNKKF